MKKTCSRIVKKFDPKNGSWICETESGKSIPIKDPKRFLKLCLPKGKPKEPKEPKKSESMETPKEPKNYPTDPDECRTMKNFPPEMPQEPETFSSDSDEHRGKKMLPGISAFKGETLPKPKQVSKEAAQLIAVANDASIRAAIANPRD